MATISEHSELGILRTRTSAAAADPDPQVPDPADTDVQPPDAERSQVQPVNAEASNSVSEEGISIELSGPEWRAAQSNQDVESDSMLGIAQGNRSFTMRELLNELKNGDADDNDGREADTPHRRIHRESSNSPAYEQCKCLKRTLTVTHSAMAMYSNMLDKRLKKQIEQNNAAMELINSVTGLDEEARSCQKILTFAAQRYATLLERNPEDYDALYNWALVLQESADNLSPESSASTKDALLEEACKKYEEATRLCPTLNEAYYNWAIAISDQAKMCGRTKEAEELWKQATINYEKAVQLNWNSPQALNNWGLALQELSAIVPAREKQTIVKTAISKFRAAIQLQFDFHRAIYNLGTVLYGLAEDISRTGGHVNSNEVSPDELYSQSAIYIAAAHALKPNYSVYSSALKLVRSMINKVGQRHLSPSLSSKSGDSPISKPDIRVSVPEIVSVSACADLTLPPGAGLRIDTIHGPVFLVAESWDSLDGWLDAIRLGYTIFARGKSDVLASIITA